MEQSLKSRFERTYGKYASTGARKAGIPADNVVRYRATSHRDRVAARREAAADVLGIAIGNHLVVADVAICHGQRVAVHPNAAAAGAGGIEGHGARGHCQIAGVHSDAAALRGQGRRSDGRVACHNAIQQRDIAALDVDAAADLLRHLAAGDGQARQRHIARIGFENAAIRGSFDNQPDRGASNHKIVMDGGQLRAVQRNR